MALAMMSVQMRPGIDAAVLAVLLRLCHRAKMEAEARPE